MLLEEFANEGNFLDLTAAAQQAALCVMVYEKEPESIEAFIGPESRLLAFSPSAGTWLPSVALIESGPKRYFAVAEGTVGFLQALAQGSPLNTLRALEDLRPETGPLSGIFYDHVSRTLIERAANFIDFSDPVIRLFLSGHSMGGAIAQTAAYFIKKRYGTQSVQVLTIGQPKAMGQIADVDLPEVFFRLTNAADAVPDYPPTLLQWIINYGTFRQFSQLFPQKWAHYGREFKMWPNGLFEDGNQPLTPQQLLLRMGFPQGHSLDSYLSFILNCAEVQEPEAAWRIRSTMSALP